MKWSLIIPTCRRPQLLARCLATQPAADEIIVSDDGEDHETRELLAAEFPQVRWLRGPRRGPAANRNHGARGATGDWLVFTDDDCVPQPGWIEALQAVQADADVVEGRTLAVGATDSPFEEHVENPRGDLLWSCNLAVRRELFARLGGFDEDFTEAAGEDMEFAWRLKHAGARIRFAPEALVHHPPRRIGLAGLWRRTRLIRWMATYRAKTGLSHSLPRTALEECLNLARSTAHLFTRPEPQRWRRRTFLVAWQWLTFPYVLPYLLYWTCRVRRS